MPQALEDELELQKGCLLPVWAFFFFGGGRSQVSVQGYADVQCMCMSMWVAAGMSLGLCKAMCLCIHVRAQSW